MEDTYYHSSNKTYKVGDILKSCERDFREYNLHRRTYETLFELKRPRNRPSRKKALFVEMRKNISKLYDHCYKVRIIEGEPFFTRMDRVLQAGLWLNKAMIAVDARERFESEEEVLKIIKKHCKEELEEAQEHIKYYWKGTDKKYATEALIDGSIEIVKVIK
ncbi:MAG: hypothetical protein ABIG20_01075 [archaeon]